MDINTAGRKPVRPVCDRDSWFGHPRNMPTQFLPYLWSSPLGVHLAYCLHDNWRAWIGGLAEGGRTGQAPGHWYGKGSDEGALV